MLDALCSLMQNENEMITPVHLTALEKALQWHMGECARTSTLTSARAILQTISCRQWTCFASPYSMSPYSDTSSKAIWI
jgi:hypothetical protein